MPELKRNFSEAKMNKDMDERLVPPGQYRDALNIQILTSDGSNVGSAQNLKGTTIKNNMAITYDNQHAVNPASSTTNAVYGLPIFVPDGPLVSGASNYFTTAGGAVLPANLGLPNLSQNRDDARWVGTSTCVGSIALPDEDKIYYFVAAGDINESPGWVVPGLSSSSTDFGLPKKDYIIEYDTITQRLKYVFVDIYYVEMEAAHTTINQNYLYIPQEFSNNQGPITNPISGQTNTTGVRVGMSIHGTFYDTPTGNPVEITIDDGVIVTDIEHEPTNNRWKIHTNNPSGILSPLTTAGPGISTVFPNVTTTTVKFSAPRVLNFNPDNIITGVNVIDNMLFWTDNTTEPKKINIIRSKAGTGGVEYLFTGLPTTASPTTVPAGYVHSNYGIANIYNSPLSVSNGDPLSIFDGDTDYFHTRLVTDKDNKGQLKIETTDNDTKVVWAKEDHIAVIKKAPTQPLHLEMSREKNPRFPTGSTVSNPITATTTYGFANGATPAQLLQSGDIIVDIVFDSPSDFRVGDRLLFTNSLGNETADSFDNFEVKAEVIASNVIDADNLATTGFRIRLITVDSNTPVIVNFWYVRRESGQPLFEFKFVRFSYRYKYVDGEYSNFAPWSQVAFLADSFEYVAKKGFNLGMRNQLRELKLTKYFTDPIIGAVSEDVVEIDLLYKETNNPTVYTIKTLTPKDEHPFWPDLDQYPLSRGEYEIKTDVVHAVVPSNQLLRPWDNVPRKALGQEITANRLVYGNYLQNYDVEDPIIELGLNQETLTSIDAEFPEPSVKSLRTYQIGVVYSDDYGRETPVLTSKNASITVPKTASSTRNRIRASLGLDTKVPSWAKYFSWYIKETSVEYYTLAMDRWYDAADGNVWLSFASAERNKLDEETFLILKKAHGENTPIHERAKYKILAIENEAPDYIKTRKGGLGGLDVSTSVAALGDANGNGFPQQGTEIITLDPLEFTGVFGSDLENNPPDDLTISFAAGNNQTKSYEVTNITVGGRVRLNLAEPMGDDAGFCNTTPPTFTPAAGLMLRLNANKVKNKPEFDGRFFVKIHKDALLERWVLRQGGASGELVPTMSTKLYYLNNNYNDVQPLGINSWQKGRYGLINGPTIPTGDDAPSVHPYNKGETVAPYTHEYSHHAKYTWGNGSSVWGVSTGDLDDALFEAGPTHHINFDVDSKGFWSGVASREAFFIDACSAYAFTGGRASMVNLATTPIQPDQFINPVDDSQEYNYLPSAYGMPGHAPADIATNIEDGRGQPSRGIWGPNNEYMDISWSGIGTGFDVINPPSAWVAPHEITHINQNPYVTASEFMRKLVTVGTQFRFENDPIQQIYTVEAYDGYTSHPHGNIWRNIPTNPTTVETGVWGIRNYITEDLMVSANAHKRQYEGQNLRQRWTIQVTPGIGSTASGYSPDKGTSRLYNGTQVVGLNHDMGDYDRIQIMERQGASGSSTFSGNPGVWETEPKKSVELDIYYQASGLIPLKLTRETNEEYLPIGTTFYSYNLFGGQGVKHTITEWDETENGQTIKFTPELPPDTYLGGDTYGQGIPDWQGFYRSDGEGTTDGPYFTKNCHYGIGGKIDFSGATHQWETIIGYWPQPTAIPPPGGVSLVWVVNSPLAIGGLTASIVPAYGFVNVYGPGDDTIQLHGFDQMGSHKNKLFRRFHDLDWNNCWVFGNGVESDRIRDDFNAIQMDNGVKASSVLAEPIREERREHGLIWSGIYNSQSGINNTNQFIMAEKITKDLNPVHGSIQKLHARDTDLITLCEDKVLKIAANKDALYNADGGVNLTATDKVLGSATAYQGNYGISTNPESFVGTPHALYFTDQMRGKVLNMAGDMHVRPISDIGMKDFFSDTLKTSTWNILGTYDEHKSEYNITKMSKQNRNMPATDRTTLSFSEKAKGWISFKSFQPEHGVSLNNDYYTFYGGEIFKHHNSVEYNRFYDIPYESTVTLTFNDDPQSVKSFNTVNYEGTQAKVDSFINITTTDAAGNTLVDINDNEYFNLTDKTGWYVDGITTNKQTGTVIEFKDKECKWFGAVCGDTTTLANLDESEFSVQGLGTAVFTFQGESPTGPGYTGPAIIIAAIVPPLPDPAGGLLPWSNYSSLGGIQGGSNPWDGVVLLNPPTLSNPQGWISIVTTPDDTYSSNTNPWTMWRPEVGNIAGILMPYPYIQNAQIGDIIPAGVIQFRLSPFTDSTNTTHMGEQLRAEDFSLGNTVHPTSPSPNQLSYSVTLSPHPQATLAVWSGIGATQPTPVNYHTYTPGNATQVAGQIQTGGLASPHITKVVIYDNSPGSINNTVQVNVYHEEWTIQPATQPPVGYVKQENLFIDIDHIKPMSVRRASICTAHSYSTNQEEPTLTSIPNMTSTLTQQGVQNQIDTSTK